MAIVALTYKRPKRCDNYIDLVPKVNEIKSGMMLFIQTCATTRHIVWWIPLANDLWKPIRVASLWSVVQKYLLYMLTWHAAKAYTAQRSSGHIKQVLSTHCWSSVRLCALDFNFLMITQFNCAKYTALFTIRTVIFGTNPLMRKITKNCNLPFLYHGEIFGTC